MRATIALIFVGMLAAVSATSAVHASLAQINSHPFGATILTAVKANLKAQTPIDEITTLLNKILADLKRDRTALQTEYDANSNRLNSEIGDLEQLIETTDGLINQLTTEITNKSNRKAEAGEELVAVQESLESTRQLLEELEINYQNTIPDADADLEDLTAAIAACQRAIAKMDTYISATASSLIQVASGAKTDLMAFSKEMERLKPSLARHGSQYTPIIHELIALTENPEPSKADKVRNLLAELLEVLKQTKLQVTEDRESFLENYNTLKPQYQNKIQGLEVKETNLGSEINSLTNQIASAQQSLADERENLQEAKTDLQETQNELAAATAAFEKASGKLDKLIEIMERLIEHFTSNVAEASDYAVNAANTGSAGLA